ncbi:MAG TPA: carboxypeptidase regulatory-like domain-containing protein [Bryobacteraceae bacterium]|nr:carboxypeptidase regulatory-like domain-containing protein [Bryobacteraceae bacterium]
MNHVCSRASECRIAFVLFAVLISATVLFAQSDLGSITGYVKDPSGAVVPNAKVTVTNATGITRTTNSNADGFYTITNIPPSVYNLSVEAPGFKKFESSNNKLDPSATLTLDANLTVGAATETVSVSAVGSRLQTESASVMQDVSKQQIDALELNGRNPIYMASLVAGTRGGNLAGLNFNFTQGPSNFNGSRNWDNLITYDGAPATRTRANGTSLGAADVDSVQEIQVLTADYAAEYGRASGGQIRIITRSGSQEFHGAAYEYLRNTAFNANTWQRNQNASTNFVPPFHYNQFGYDIGGPFYIPGKLNKDKSKFFWYWGQEWVRYRFTDTATWTVPSMLMRQGNFSELLDPNNVYITRKDASGNKIPVLITNPSNGVPFAGNVIPANLLSQNGLGILKAFPVPNLTSPLNGNQYFYAAALHPQNQRKDTLAVDINITEKQRLQFRRLNYSFFEYQPLDGTPLETPKYFNRPNQTNSLDHVWTISPTIVNEFLATVSLDDVYIPVDQAHFFDRTTAGINYPYIFPSGKLIPTRIPTAAITNFTTLTGNPYPSHSSGPIYTLSDSLTWIKGAHTFKFGFAFERSGENDNDEINVSACPTCTNNQNGQFSFTDSRPGGTGVAVANAALGLFDTYSELGQRGFTIFRSNMYEMFAQDSWKVNQKLTVNLGLRYTINFPNQAIWRNMSAFDPSLYDPSKAVGVDPKTGAVILTPGSDRYNGIVIPGNGWPDSAKGRFPEATAGTYDYLFRGGVRPPYFSNIQWSTPQPRVGIAYAMNDKTVFRTGVGRFFTRLGVSDSIFLGGNPPFQPTASVTNGIADNPGGTSTNVLPLTVTTYPLTWQNPEAWNWNFTVERQIFWKSVASVAYVGRRGLHLPREEDINQPTVQAIAPYLDSKGNLTVNLDSLRPYKGYNSIRSSENVATSRYNSLQLMWNRRFANDFMFGVAYTYSRSYDDGSAYRDILPDTYYAQNLWALSSFDTTHVMTINYLYELPFGRGKHFGSNWNRGVDAVMGGWQISGITQLQTGQPCAAVVNTDYARVGVDGNMNDCGGTGELWALNGPVTVAGNFSPNGTNDPHFWFNPTTTNGSPLLTAPAIGTFVTGPSSRDFVHNPGLENWNLGLYKKFAINERMGFQFRAEAFDAFNHPNLDRSNGGNGAQFNPTSPQFGKVTGKNNDVRNLQLSLRFYF